MWMNLEEVLNLGFLGESCFLELLTLTSVVRYLEFLEGSCYHWLRLYCAGDYLGTGQKTFPKRHTNQLSEQTIKQCFTPWWQQHVCFCFRKNYYVCQNSGHPSGRVQLPILRLFHPSSCHRVHRNANHGLCALHLEGTCGSWYDDPHMLKSLAECLPP